MGVRVNGMTRFATGGARVQRLNPDGTIPRPGRAVGFNGTVDLRHHASNGMAKLTIKVGSHLSQTRDIDFSNVGDLANVTVQEAVDAINAAGFTDSIANVEPSTGRLLLGASGIVGSRIGITFQRRWSSSMPALSVTQPNGIQVHYLTHGVRYHSEAPVTVSWEADSGTSNVIWLQDRANNLITQPFQQPGNWIGWNDFVREFFAGSSQVPNFDHGRFREFEPATSLPGTNGIMQVTGPLASALDFGGGRRFGGDLRCLSFFDDEIMNIGLSKNIRDKEEIDQEGANGTITRMVKGAMIQGIDPVLAIREKNYDLLELVQGGRFNRATGEYDPPMAHDSERPRFWIEILSPVYGRGVNQQANISGYERILIRCCTGIEGDVPIAAKAWAEYVYNIAAAEYTGEGGVRLPAWQEQFLTVAQFDALDVLRISIPGIGDLDIGENLSAAESRAAPLSALGGGLDAAARSVGTHSAAAALAGNLDRMNKEQLAAYAKDKGIPLNADGTKTEILAAIREGSGE